MQKGPPFALYLGRGKPSECRLGFMGEPAIVKPPFMALYWILERENKKKRRPNIALQIFLRRFIFYFKSRVVTCAAYLSTDFRWPIRKTSFSWCVIGTELTTNQEHCDKLKKWVFVTCIIVKVWNIFSHTTRLSTYINKKLSSWRFCMTGLSKIGWTKVEAKKKYSLFWLQFLYKEYAFFK